MAATVNLHDGSLFIAHVLHMEHAAIAKESTRTVMSTNANTKVVVDTWTKGHNFQNDTRCIRPS